MGQNGRISKWNTGDASAGQEEVMEKRIAAEKRENGLWKKAAVLTITAGAVALAAGCGSRMVDRKEALEYALADAGLTAGDISITRQELEKTDGKNQYEIEFTSGGYGYSYEIDAFSGAVTGVSILAISGNQEGGDVGQSNGQQSRESGESGQPNGHQSPEPGESSQSAGQQSQESGESGQPAGQQSQESGESGQTAGQQSRESGESGQTAGQQSQESGKPDQGSRESVQPSGAGDQTGQVDTMDSAKVIALTDAGLTEEEVTFTKEKLDWDDGVAVYDIDFYTADREYEYEINAATGVIMDRSVELFRHPGGAGTASLIGEEKAKETAAAHAGFSVDEVFFTKIKLEEEDGRLEYEIEFYKERIEYEFTIDAAAGTVLEYESEYDD